MIKRTMILVAVLALALTACSGGDSEGGGSDGGSASGDATETTAADDSGDSGDGGGSSDCGENDGEDGVVRTFCDGPATVSFDIGESSGDIDGGQCELSGGFFVVNAGTVVGPDFTGEKPDYAGLLLPPEPGDFATGDGASVTITWEGEAYVIEDVTGTRTDTEGTWTGSVMFEDSTISGSFTC